MDELKLKANQAALILEASEEGEVNVDVAFPETNTKSSNFAAVLCQIIAQKLTQDDQFQAEIMSTLEEIRVNNE